jgi:Tfp pilus assembly protein PilE
VALFLTGCPCRNGIDLKTGNWMITPKRSLRSRLIYNEVKPIQYPSPMGDRKHFFSQPSQSSEGLTYVEIMVSMMISALFLSTTMQAYIAATAIRARTHEMNAAIASIQADAEVIRQMAQVSPQSAADCQLPASGSYAQQIMLDVIAKDKAAFNINSIEQSEGQSVVQQYTTLPMVGLPSDYELRRILSVDKHELPSVQVLKISYQVLRHSTQSQFGDHGDRPQSEPFQVETPVAQRYTSVLPNAALVCFF